MNRVIECKPGQPWVNKRDQAKTHEFPAYHIRADVGADTIDEKERTFDIIASTGARALQYHWDIGVFWEELSLKREHVRLDRLNSGAPFLKQHRSYDLESVLGAIERGSVKLTAKSLNAKVRMSQTDRVADVWRDIKDKILGSVSAGYRVFKYEELEAKAEDGKRVLRAIDWEPYEVSLVVIPAELNAVIRSETRSDVHTATIIELTRAQGEQGAMTEEERRAAEAAAALAASQRAAVIPPNTPPATTVATLTTADVDAARAAGAAAEGARRDGILTACRAAKLPEAFANQLIADPKMTTLDLARAAIIDKLAAGDAEQPGTTNHVRAQMGATSIEKKLVHAEAWLLQRSGQMPAMAASRYADLKATAAIDPGPFGNFSLADVAREILEEHNVKTRGLSRDEIIGQAFKMRSGSPRLFIRSATQGTSDFPTLLENVMYKSLRAAYEITPDTWSKFCGVGSVVDFRDHPQYKVGAFGVLDDLTELGEYRRKQIQDGKKEVLRATTKGDIISISREAIINDDMNVFTQLPAMFGRSAKLTIEKFAYGLLALNSNAGPTLLEDGNPVFFARTQTNIAAGAAPTVDVIDGMRILLARQKDLNGEEFLNIRPRLMLAPVELGGKLKVINDSTYDPDISGKIQVNNKVRGVVSEVVDTPQLTGNRYYMFADPAVTPVLKIVFLNGQQEPFMEAMRGWEVDGTELKIRIDFGGGGVDYRGAVTNPGP